MNADLGAAPRAELVALADRLAAGCRLEHERLPQEGLYLLQLEESIDRTPFHLGEMPVGVAQVRLTAGDGRSCRGGAVLLHADAEQAVAAAVCDAVATAGWPGADEVRALARRGAAARRERERLRALMLERTRVDFAELGQEAG